QRGKKPEKSGSPFLPLREMERRQRLIRLKRPYHLLAARLHLRIDLHHMAVSHIKNIRHELEMIFSHLQHGQHDGEIKRRRKKSPLLRQILQRDSPKKPRIKSLQMTRRKGRLS